MTGSKTELKFELKSFCAKASLPHRILLPPTSFVCLFHHLVLFYFLQGGDLVPAPAAPTTPKPAVPFRAVGCLLPPHPPRYSKLHKLVFSKYLFTIYLTGQGKAYFY